MGLYQHLKISDVLTRHHRFSLLLLLGLISDPDEHLRMGTFLYILVPFHCDNAALNLYSSKAV